MLTRLLAFALVLLIASPALAQKTKSVLGSEITSQFPNNTTGAITPQVLRNVTNDFLNSWQQYPAVNAQSGITYTFQALDYGSVVTFNNAGAIAATLPTPTNAGFGVGYNVYVRDIGAGSVTITPSGATINGAATLTVTQNQSVWIISDGTNYQVWNNSTGTLTSLNMTVPSSIFSITGVPCTSTCALSMTVAGTSGAIPFFNSATTLSSTNALTANGVLYGGGAGVAPGSTAASVPGAMLVGGTPPTFTFTPTLGTAGSVGGSLAFANGTSGSVTISPSTGALGSSILTLPTATDTLVGKSTTDILSNKTLSQVTVTLGFNATGLVTNADLAFSATTVNGTNCILGSSCSISASAGSVTVGSTGVVGATTSFILENQGGTLAAIDPALIYGSSASGTVLRGGVSPTFITTPTLGTAGSIGGSLAFANGTSGTITLSPTTGGLGSTVLTLPSGTDTLIARSTTDTLFNKTYNTASTGNVFSVNSNQISAVTGTGNTIVLQGSPTLTTPNIGSATAISVNTATISTTTGTYNVLGGKTLTVNNSMELSGVDASPMLRYSMPSLSATIAALNIKDQQLSGGANVTSQGRPTGTVTVDCGLGPLQYITNSGGFTINAPTSDGSCILLVTNGPGAGSITFNGFNVGTNVGDALTTVNSYSFSINIWRISGLSTVSGYRIAAHQ